MKRREFLKFGAVGTASTMISPAVAWGQSSGMFRLTIAPCDYEMIDGTTCYMCFFFQEDEPHPVLRARQGTTVEIELTNDDTVPHGFAITGVPIVGASEIRPGETRKISFTAPIAGSYIYYDPTNDPVSRLVGLHGALVITSQHSLTPAGSPTPYGRGMHTPAVRALFDALGSSDRFPGKKWSSSDPDREKIWVFSQTDPELNRKVDRGEPVDGASVRTWFRPRYFHINYLSGIDTAEHDGQPSDASKGAHLIMPSGKQGEPTLIRSMNAGLCSHSPHIHGNHVMVLSGHNRAGRVLLETNVLERDVWQLRPMERRDVLLPFERPPDIPLDRWPMKDEPWPLRYVMHCHCEMSQTAAGGNYPQGMVTHWEMTGAL